MKFLEKNKLTIFLFSIFGVLATDSFAPLIQNVSQSYPGVAEPIIKQLVTLPSTISMVVGLLAGFLVRYIEKRKLIFTGLILFGLGSIGAFWIPNLGVHFLLRSILGVGIGLVNTLNLSLIGDFFVGEERAAMMGGSLASSKIFAIMVPPVAALLAANNWQNVYFMYAIALIVLVYAVFALDKPVEKQDAEETEKSKGKIPPIAYVLAFAQFLLLAIYFILVTDLPYLLNITKNKSTVISGFGLSAATIGTMLAGLVFSKMYAKLKNWIAPVALIVMAGGFFVVVHSMSTALILFGLILAGFGVGLLISAINLLTTNSVGDADSTAAISMVTCASSLGVFASPFLYSWNPINFEGMTAVQSDFNTAGLVYLVIGIISLGFVLFSKKRKTQGVYGGVNPSS